MRSHRGCNNNPVCGRGGAERSAPPFPYRQPFLKFVTLPGRPQHLPTSCCRSQQHCRIRNAYVSTSSCCAARSSHTCFCSAALAQQPVTSSLPATPQPAFSGIPVSSAAAGSTYLQTDLTGTNGGSAAYVLGWYGIPQVHFTKHLSVLGDFTDFYNYHAHTEENVRGFTGGPVYA